MSNKEISVDKAIKTCEIIISNRGSCIKPENINCKDCPGWEEYNHNGITCTRNGFSCVGKPEKRRAAKLASAKRYMDDLGQYTESKNDDK